VTDKGPTIRLAHVPGAQGDNVLLGQRGVDQLPDDRRPALLVSFFYLEPFLRNRANYAYRDWVLDSGAFSAHNSGVEIDLQEFTDTAARLLEEDPTLTEVFALDVIGDHEASLRNAERMWEQGVPAIPTYHRGSPEDALLHLAENYPKIALGGVALERVGVKLPWASECFARVWPKRIHGFGFGGKKTLMALPWHSVDATNWEVGPCRFGQWRSFGTMSVRGSDQNLRAEVEWHLELERKARARWKKEMEKLDASDAPALRMAVVETGKSRGRQLSAFGGLSGPVLRLAVTPLPSDKTKEHKYRKALGEGENETEDTTDGEE